MSPALLKCGFCKKVFRYKWTSDHGSTGQPVEHFFPHFFTGFVVHTVKPDKKWGKNV